MQKILIMGLPGSGKTTLAAALKTYLEMHSPEYPVPLEYQQGDIPVQSWSAKVTWFNADQVREKYSDWDFSKTGRIRQSLRMLQFAVEAGGDFVICDFVAPLVEQRNNFAADWTIWVDTITSSRFEDTNSAFVAPEEYDFRINTQDAEYWAEYIGQRILMGQRRPEFDWRAPTVQMLGRWQPWHPGHRALFERLLARTGQVVIQIRDVEGWQGSNPFGLSEVKARIQRDLDPLYQGRYTIQVVPNIVHIGWGRGVGYTSGEELFDESITEISGTAIRAEMGLC